MRENILPTVVMAPFAGLRYIPLRFFALVTKINKKSKAQERVLVVTDLHIYSCTKEDGSIKRCLSIENIEKIITCRNRCEVALIVMEKGEEYDLLFQTHSPSSLDDFVRQMPKDVEVRDVAMSILSHHNVGAEFQFKLEKPKGYSRDVADSVKWKVSSWTTLERSGKDAPRGIGGADGGNALAASPLSSPVLPTTSPQPSRLAHVEESTANKIQETEKTFMTKASRSGSVKSEAESVAVGRQIRTQSSGLYTSDEVPGVDSDEEEDDTVSHSSAQPVTSGSSGVNSTAPPPLAATPKRIGNEEEDDESAAEEDSGDDFDISVDFNAVHRSAPLQQAAAAPQQQQQRDASLKEASQQPTTLPSPKPQHQPQQQQLPVVEPTPPREVHQVVSSPTTNTTTITTAEPLRRRHSYVGVQSSSSFVQSNMSFGSSSSSSLFSPLPSNVNGNTTLPVVPFVTTSASTTGGLSGSNREQELTALLLEERSRFAAQLLATSELLAVERTNATTLRKIVDELRMEVERLSLENMILKRPASDL